MRFLLDVHMPLSAAAWLRSRGHDATHVREVGMREALDEAIWVMAIETNSILISKDRDFADWTAVRQPRPQVVWIRTGNMLKRHQVDHLNRVWLTVLTQLSQGVPLVTVQR